MRTGPPRSRLGPEVPFNRWMIRWPWPVLLASCVQGWNDAGWLSAPLVASRHLTGPIQQQHAGLQKLPPPVRMRADNNGGECHLK
jgi:hypothetical protein